MLESLSDLLGLHEPSEALGAPEMALRGVIVYAFVVLVVRFGHRRFLARSTAFDIVLAIVLGSLASRAITGTSPFLPTLAAVVALVALHWLTAAVTFHSHAFGVLVKGQPRELVRAGAQIPRAMRRSHISTNDLDEALHLHGLDNIAEVATARLERNGDISIVKREASSGGHDGKKRPQRQG